jgi:hypothetical protein
VNIIEACMKLYYDKDHHANGNAYCHSRHVDNSVIPVTDQTSECGFEIVFKHNYILVLKLFTGFAAYTAFSIKKYAERAIK